MNIFTEHSNTWIKTCFTVLKLYSESVHVCVYKSFHMYSYKQIF